MNSGGHSMNLERKELIRVQSLQVFALMSLANFKLTSWMAIRPLLLAVDPSETERFHLLCILRVSYKMKEPGAFAIMQKPFAFEFSRVPRDRKMNFCRPVLEKSSPEKSGSPATPNWCESDARRGSPSRKTPPSLECRSAGWSSRRSVYRCREPSRHPI